MDHGDRDGALILAVLMASAFMEMTYILAVRDLPSACDSFSMMAIETN